MMAVVADRILPLLGRSDVGVKVISPLCFSNIFTAGGALLPAVIFCSNSVLYSVLADGRRLWKVDLL
jgi:hypothetical protein